MEFIGKNKKENDCVIVAAHNALQWQGKSTSYDVLEKIAKKFYKYVPKNGFKMAELGEFLDTIDVYNHRVPFTAGWGSIEKRVLSGNSLMLCYAFKDTDMGHMVMIVPGENRTVKVVNSSLTWADIVTKEMKKQIVVDIWNIGKST